MKRGLILITIICCILLAGCGTGEKKLTCKYNGDSDIMPEIIATLDSNDKISEIEIHVIYQTKEEASKDMNEFKMIHGENAMLDGNTVIVKNVHDPDTLFGKQYSKTVGYTKEEFQSFLGNYTCE